MVGVVRTEELNSQDLESGSVVVFLDGDLIDIATLEHLTADGSWVVVLHNQAFQDPYVAPITARLCKLMVVADRGVYPLKFNQWAKSIKNGEVDSDKQVNFEIIPAKFKEGKHVKTCSTCFSHFMGGSRQPDCKKCCDENVTAQIKIEKKVKPKRPRMKSNDEIKALALTSFQMGVKAAALAPNDNRKAFDAWLEKQF